MQMPSMSGNHIDNEILQREIVDFVRLELDGRDPARVYPLLARLIDTVAAVEEAYYREFRRQGLGKQAEELRNIGHSDKVARSLTQITQSNAGLLPTTGPEVVGLLEVVLDHGRAWVDVGTNQVRRLLFALSNLAPSDATQPLLATTMGTQEDAETHAMLRDRAGDGAVDVIIALYQTPAGDAHASCRLEVAVDVLDWLGDLSGITVILQGDDVDTAVQTDTYGKAVFEGVDCGMLAQYRIIVDLPGV